jgi:hypothetical protein
MRRCIFLARPVKIGGDYRKKGMEAGLIKPENGAEILKKRITL